MIRVSLVEDDPVFRDAVLKTLADAPGLRLLDASADAATARAAFIARPPDVALVDIHLGGASGIALVAALAPRLPATAFLMLTAEEGAEALFDALKAGAVGYLLKHAAGPDLLQAIDEARRGGSPMSWSIARRVVQSFALPIQPGLAALTPRERDVLDQLARGLSYKQAAARLGVSEDTVRTHIRGLYAKLQVNSRTEAVVKYLGR